MIDNFNLEYAKIVLAVMSGENNEANRNVLISRKGKGIVPNSDVSDTKLQQFVWEETWKIIEKHVPVPATVSQ